MEVLAPFFNRTERSDSRESLNTDKDDEKEEKRSETSQMLAQLGVSGMGLLHLVVDGISPTTGVPDKSMCTFSMFGKKCPFEKCATPVQAVSRLLLSDLFSWVLFER